MKPKKSVFIGLDTSGSMSNEDIRQCFGEVDQMWRTGVEVWVGECDAHLDRKNDVWEYKGTYPKTRGGLSGGGGTSVKPLIEYVNDNPHKYSCFIYLTDGYMSDPGIESKMFMMTVLTMSGTDPKELQERKQFGYVIKMKEDEFHED